MYLINIAFNVLIAHFNACWICVLKLLLWGCQFMTHTFTDINVDVNIWGSLAGHRICLCNRQRVQEQVYIQTVCVYSVGEHDMSYSTCVNLRRCLCTLLSPASHRSWINTEPEALSLWTPLLCLHRRAGTHTHLHLPIHSEQWEEARCLHYHLFVCLSPRAIVVMHVCGQLSGTSYVIIQSNRVHLDM